MNGAAAQDCSSQALEMLRYNATHLNPEVFMSATLTIRMDDALERELKQVAAATHRPKGDIVREALRRQLALARFRWDTTKLLCRLTFRLCRN